MPLSTSLHPPRVETAESALFAFLSDAILWMPDHVDAASAWIEHVPFAFWIMEALGPRCFVELGTHTGVSYLAFCQAARRLGIETRGYAVDTWRGDQHTGFYGEEVFQKLSEIHDRRYGAFSRLVRSTFDDAMRHFDDGSIDLLHIDGLHTYAAVKHDVETWKPKLAARAVVLLHDTNVREGDFGVFRLWRELAQTHPHFEFLHGHGLGVLGVGSAFPPALAALFSASSQPQTASRIRELFARFGAQLSALPRHAAERELSARDARIAELEGAVAARQADAHRLSAELAAKADRADELQRELAAERAQVEKLVSALSTLRGEHERVSGLVTVRDEQLAALQSALARQQEQAKRVSAELATAAAELAKLKHRLSWRIHSRLRAARRVAKALAKALRKTMKALLQLVCLPLRAPLRSLALRRRALTGLAWLLPRSDRRMIDDVWLLRGSSLFDAQWYLEQNRTVAKKKKDPVVHYVRTGARKGHNPGPLFDGNWYLAHNPDVAASGMNPLVHYLRCGAAEGRSAEPACSGGLDARARGFLVPPDPSRRYSEWVAEFDTLTAKDIDRIRRHHIDKLDYRPTFSIIMPVYSVEIEWLREAIDSVRNQLYPDWELCIADDHSINPGIHGILRDYEKLDSRIRIYLRQENGGIAAASNTALKLASGEFVILMDHDDVIPQHALYMVAVELNAHRDADLIYSDEDQIDEDGRRLNPYFKPDWNPSLVLCQNYFNHLGVYRRSLVEDVGGFRIGFDGSQDHDLLLRCTEHTTSERIRHIRHILYHWRSLPGSTASSIDSKPYAWEAGARAVSDHLKRRGIRADVRRAVGQFYSVTYSLPEPSPKVSILVPSTAKLQLIMPCLISIFQKSTYSNYEVLLALNEKHYAVRERREFLDAISSAGPLRLLTYPDRPFNFAWVNNWASAQAAGSVLCLLNDDARVDTPDWLETLVARVCLDGVGAVGPMMCYPDGTIQHGGVILGPGGVADHAHKFLSRGQSGYFGRAGLDQDLSCVTAGCMVIRREVFEGVGRFNERFEIAFNDVDLCLRVRQAGWRIMWTPAAMLYHHESASVGRHDSPARAEKFAAEAALMRTLWGGYLDNDPYYNPNLSLRAGETYCLAFPPRRKWPWRMLPSHDNEDR